MHKEKTSHDIPKSDGRGKNTNKAFNEEVKHRIRKHIESFARVESHYCRADTRKEYLESRLNVSKMHELYVEKCREEMVEPVKESYYRHIFCTEYNIAFHQPKKDCCDFCEAKRVKENEKSLTAEDIEEKAEHDAEKKAMRDGRKSDRELNDESGAVILYVRYVTNVLKPHHTLRTTTLYTHGKGHMNVLIVPKNSN